MSRETLNLNLVATEVKCNNCGQIDQGLFCSHCGSHLKSQRITLPGLLFSIIDFFYNLEEKYIHTFLALLLKPVNFIQHYLNGTRDKYYIPFKYFFLNLGINFFVYSYFNLATINEDVLDVEAEQLLELESDVIFNTIINDYGSFLSLLFIPLYVVATTLLFRKSTYNLAERATAITFLLGQLMIIQAVLNLISVVIHPFYEIQKYLILGAELYIVYILCYKFFKASWVESIWKSVVISFFVLMSMRGVLMLMQDVLDLYYSK